MFSDVCHSLKLSVADIGFACGRYGIRCGRCVLWPISSVADIVVADMVCGRYRRNSGSGGWQIKMDSSRQSCMLKTAM